MCGGCFFADLAKTAKPSNKKFAESWLTTLDEHWLGTLLLGQVFNSFRCLLTQTAHQPNGTVADWCILAFVDVVRPTCISKYSYSTHSVKRRYWCILIGKAGRPLIGPTLSTTVCNLYCSLVSCRLFQVWGLRAISRAPLRHCDCDTLQWLCQYRLGLEQKTWKRLWHRSFLILYFIF